MVPFRMWAIEGGSASEGPEIVSGGFLAAVLLVESKIAGVPSPMKFGHPQLEKD